VRERLANGLRRARAWAASIPASIVDGGIAVAFLVAMLVERASVVSTARLPLAAALSVGVAAGLGLRRRWPFAGYLLGSAAMAAEALFIAPSAVSPYANFIGVFSVGLYDTAWRLWATPPLVIAGVVGYFAGAGGAPMATPAGVVFSWLLAFALGVSIARRRDEQRIAQGLLHRQAIAEERARIARELHDVVGHTVTLMLVQAGAARRMLDRDVAQSRALLSSVESTGRDALGELDRVLGILRQDEGKGAGDGEPGLNSLPALVARMADAGMTVDVEADPATADLPRSISLSAYRIVQEALTNALKHGHAPAARVAIRRTAGALDVAVEDDGTGPGQGFSPGRGLLGIQERAAMFGGTVSYTSAGGGFGIRAVLPLP
jgi:signal transduction histidine kinase